MRNMPTGSVMPACCRKDFQDAVQALSGMLAEPAEFEQVIWKIEYLSQAARYHFYGMSRHGELSGIGHLYDTASARAANVPSVECVPVALGFDRNDWIVAYGASRTVSTDILEQVETLGATGAEVLRICVEARSQDGGGRKVMWVTDIAFIGLQSERQADLLKSVMLADGPSLRWCRDRRFIGAAPALARIGDPGILGN